MEAGRKEEREGGGMGVRGKDDGREKKGEDARESTRERK